MTPFQLISAIGTGKPAKKPAATGIDEDDVRARFMTLVRQQEERLH